MKKTVLIVDDNNANLYLLKSLLEAEGLNVMEAENGQVALDKAHAHPPDLIVSDILMPVMDGYALCRRCKSDPRLRNIPFLFYTATYTEPKDEQFALDLGAERFILKPQEPDILMKIIEEMLAEDYTPRQAEARPLGEEMEYFRQYNEILFNKLEKKMSDLKIANQKLDTKGQELREMTQQLWQTAKLATMGELAASIAHELNNPLTTISLRIEAMIAGTHADHGSMRHLDIIQKETKRMADLIANLLQFSRRNQQQISTLDVCEEIEKTLELSYYHLRKYNISVVCEYAPDLPHIHADRQQLRQLFLNLFTNASDAMPRGGTLTIRVMALPEAGRIGIEIADTGTGMPPETLPKVLEPFYTTKPEGKGTGLGLAICRRIVEEHGGSFELVSEGIAGRGTTARICLPLKNGGKAAALT